jgi:hypothetical protein
MGKETMVIVKRPWESQEDFDRRAAQAEAQREEADRAAEQRRREEEVRVFLESPRGRARASYKRGDHLFQISLDLERVGRSSPYASPSDSAVDVLQDIVAEGWTLHSFATAFVIDHLDIADGYSTGPRGRLIGTYIFKLAEPAPPMDERVKPTPAAQPAAGRA